MEYSIYLNQARCIDWKLTYPEAILCSYYANEHNWVRTKINESDGDYFCITIAKLIKDLPIIGALKSPCDTGVPSVKPFVGSPVNTWILLSKVPPEIPFAIYINLHLLCTKLSLYILLYSMIKMSSKLGCNRLFLEV